MIVNAVELLGTAEAFLRFVAMNLKARHFSGLSHPSTTQLCLVVQGHT